MTVVRASTVLSETIFGRPELEDREQVGQVVTQHVAGDRDGVFAVAGPVQGESSGLGDVHDLDLQAVGVQLLQRRTDLLQQLGVVRARLVQPEHRRGAGGPGMLLVRLRSYCAVKTSACPQTKPTVPVIMTASFLIKRCRLPMRYHRSSHEEYCQFEEQGERT